MITPALTIVPNDDDPSMTMSSREIAELTGKRHGHVVDGVRKMLSELWCSEAPLGDKRKIVHQEFQGVSWERDDRGYISNIHLPKRETLILVSGYSVQLRAKIVDRWAELEAHQAPAALPDFTNPADAARAWAAEYEGRVKVQAELDAA